MLGLLAVTAQAAPSDGLGYMFLNLAHYSTGQTEFGFFNIYAHLGQPLPEGFYAKGKVYNFMLVNDKRGVPQAASFEALFPGVLIFGVFFSEKPEGSGLLWYLLTLMNGEIGFRKEYFSLGIVNGFHPFFTRSNPYHDAGVRLGIGKSQEVGISIYEQDRMRFSGVNYGVRVDFQAYLIP